MIHIGTSGYSYEDWKGFFYPESLSSDDFLAFYANHFDAVELNFSYYRMPTAKQLHHMAERTAGKVLFSVKAHQCFTHQRTPSSYEYNQFSDALVPLKDAGCLGAVLLQFPNSFHQTQENRQYLSRLSDKLPFPLVAEFRNSDWVTPGIFQWLQKLNIGFCCVDEPQIAGLLPRVHICTASIAYVRFHGRNSQKWYTHNHAYERYDYRYSSTELKEWMLPILQLDSQADKTMVFFNNHFQAKAVDGAKQLSQMLLQMKASPRKE